MERYNRDTGREEGSPENLTLEGLAALAPYQDTLFAALDAADYARYLELRPGQVHEVRMRSLAEPHAATFLQALPDPEQNLLLSNQEFTTYCCFRLGRVPHEGAPCPVCRNANLDENGYHQVSGCVKGHHRYRRHNELLDEVARHAVRAGLQVFKDCSITLSNSRQRPSDLAIRRFANGKDASVDLIVFNPLSPSHLNPAADGQELKAATRVEASKVRKYAALFANQTTVEFMPMAATVYGGWGPGAENMIETILAAEADALHMKPGPLRFRLYARLGAILARCNARAILDRRPTHLRQALANAE